MKKTLIASALLAACFPVYAALPQQAIMSHDNHAAEWKPNIAYVAGSMVTYQGQQYRTKWWSQNTPPQNTNWSSWQRVNAIPDGDYNLKLQTGNANRVDWYENDVLISSQTLTPAAKQKLELAIRGRSKGNYSYKAVLSNAEGQISSTPMPVMVLDEEEYKIGVRTYYFTDMNRLDPFVDTPRQRELMVKIWYPASQSTTKPLLHHGFHTEKATHDDWLQGRISRSRQDAEIAEKETPFPVLVFNPGYYANVESNQFLYEDLAQKGYVVVIVSHPHQHAVVTMGNGEEIKYDPDKRAHDFDGGIDWDGVQEVLTRLRDQPFTDPVKQEIYDTFAKTTGDHKQLKIWQDDTRFVMAELEKLNVDRNSVFAKRLDLSRIGLLGTSYGGTTSTQYLSEIDNPSIRAAANIDGQEYYLTAKHQFNKPVLLLSTESWVSTDLDLVYDTASNDAYRLHIKGSLHGDIGDGTLLYSNGVKPSPESNLGPIPSQTMLDITNKSVLAFFNQYVKSQPQIHKNALEFLKDYSEAEVRFKLQK